MDSSGFAVSVFFGGGVKIVSLAFLCLGVFSSRWDCLSSALVGLWFQAYWLTRRGFEMLLGS